MRHRKHKITSCRHISNVGTANLIACLWGAGKEKGKNKGGKKGTIFLKAPHRAMRDMLLCDNTQLSSCWMFPSFSDLQHEGGCFWLINTKELCDTHPLDETNTKRITRIQKA